jgi:hypothetical protein
MTSCCAATDRNGSLLPCAREGTVTVGRGCDCDPDVSVAMTIERDPVTVSLESL